MINTNLPPVLHRFGDIALERSKSLHLATPLRFNPDGRVTLGVDDLRKVFIERSQVAIVPNGVETLPKISIA